MEKNRKRELQMYIFRFFIRESWRKPVKDFFYQKRAELRYQQFLRKNRNRKIAPVSNLVITLTSYPARIGTLPETLVSLLSQNLKPERVILWLAEEQFPNKEKDLSEKILKLCDFGLEIRWCQDLKSYKKLIPALLGQPDKMYVTAYDDIFYPKNWLRALYEAYQSDPDSIFCHRVHRVTFDNEGRVAPYQKWKKCLIKDQEEPGDVLFFTTGGGVLFPPGCFYEDVLNVELFKKLCPLADDLWFWMMIILKRKKIRIVKNNVYRIRNNGGTQEEEPLWKINREAGYNDDQLQNLMKYYEIPEEGLSEFFRERSC